MKKQGQLLVLDNGQVVWKVIGMVRLQPQVDRVDITRQSTIIKVENVYMIQYRGIVFVGTELSMEWFKLNSDGNWSDPS